MAPRLFSGGPHTDSSLDFAELDGAKVARPDAIENPAGVPLPPKVEVKQAKPGDLPQTDG